MDISKMFDSMMTTLGNNVPTILAAILILIVGWIVAVAIRAGIRKLLGWLRLNERVFAGTEKKIDLEGGISKGVYYLLLILVFIAFFDKLNLKLVAGPLKSLADQVFAYAPQLAGAIILLLVAWFVATFVRAIVTRLLGRTKLDEKLTREADMRPMSESIGQILYWLIFLLFLPAILSTLGMRGLLGPVEGMVDELLGVVPNIFAAVLIGLVGWFVARIVRDIIANLLAAAGADSLGERAGLKDTLTLSRLIGLIVYVVIIVPVFVAALDALNIESVSGPATRMLEVLMGAIPSIFAAALILGISYFILRFVAEIVTRLLQGTGFDRLPAKLGFGESFLAAPTASVVVGKLVLFFGMLFAVVEAANRLGFAQITELVTLFIEFGAQILLGILIFGIGVWIARIIHQAILAAGGPAARTWAGLARVGILGMVIAMGLRAMGVADDIVHLAFGLILGAIAVAVALSFGLGGREAAGKQMEHWLGKLRGE